MGTSALGLMYEGNTYQSSYDGTTYKGYSTETGYDVKAYALSLDDTAYMGYIFVGGRSADDRITAENKAAADGEKGIVKSTLTWHYEGEENITTVEDTKFPFEFLLPVYDADKKIMFNVTTEFGNGEIKTLGKEYTVAPNPIKQVENNYIDASDFTETAVNNTISFIAGYGEFGGIKLENNRDALRDYFYYDYTTKTVDDTATGLYDAETGAYVLSGVDNMKKQNWSKFIDDFKFRGTYNGTTYTLPITNYATTDSHNVFQFMVDCSGYEDVITKDAWAKANWTDVKIVNDATGKEVPFQSFSSYNFFNDCYRVCFSKIEYIAEQLPEYFYVGSKVTAQSNKKIYAYGIDGPITNNADSSAVSCKFKDEVSLKFTYNGREYTVPINRVRADSGHTALYLSITVDAFNDATDAGISSFANVLNSTNITNVKLTTSKINIGAFPVDTIFVSATEINGGKIPSNSDDGVIYLRGNSTPYYYTFAVETAGEYDVYCLAWDDNGDTKRGGIVYVNDVKQDFCNSYDLATSTRRPFWEPTGSVTLKTDANIIHVPVNIGNDSNARFGGIAFVPAGEDFSIDATQSAIMANKDTGIVDNISGKRNLSIATGRTTFSPCEEGIVNVVVNGVDVAVTAGAGILQAEKFYDTNGNFIKSATVTDAITAAGLSKRNASGQVNAVLVDGKNVYPDRTLLYDGMAITVVDGAQVTKANFAPVLRNDVISSLGETSAQTQGIGMNTSSGFKGTSAVNSYTKIFPFVTLNTAETTEAANTNIIGCRLQGYFTVAGIADNTGVVGAFASMRKGDKVYFLGDKIVKLAASMGNIFTGDEDDHVATTSIQSYVSNLAIASAEDALVAIHTPFVYYNQKAISSTGFYDDLGEVFISNTSAVNQITATNKIKDGKWQLLSTGTVPCQIMIVGVNGAVKSILKDQIVTGIAPLTITLEEGEKAYVWKSSPYNGTITSARIWNMKPLCDVLTY